MADNIKNYYEIFKGSLEQHDKEGSVSYAISLLSQGLISVPDLYEKVLAPSLNSLLIGRDEEHDMIWREHVMTNIVRSVIESAYPYVQKERAQHKREASGGKVMLVCPEEEYHDLGIRMGADFYTIAGFDVTFIGSNTPKSNILSAAKEIHPDIVGISVSNYLNLFALDKIISQLRRELPSSVRIVLSGSALRHAGRPAADFSADAIVNSFSDTMGLREDSHANSH